jgi:hypothetical protein
MSDDIDNLPDANLIRSQVQHPIFKTLGDINNNPVICEISQLGGPISSPSPSKGRNRIPTKIAAIK